MAIQLPLGQKALTIDRNYTQSKNKITVENSSLGEQTNESKWLKTETQAELDIEFAQARGTSHDALKSRLANIKKY